MPLRVPLISLVLSAALSIGLAQAQSTRIYVGSGAAFPMGPGEMVDWWRTGVVLDVSAGHKFRNGLELTLDLGRASLPVRDDKVLFSGVDLDVRGGDFTISMALAGVRVEFERGTVFRPYLHVGAGLHVVRIEDLRVDVVSGADLCESGDSCQLRVRPSERPDETLWGIRVSAGLARYMGPRYWLFAEPSYHLLFSDFGRLGLVPLRLGLARVF